ncbi:hypothetical protein CIG75_07285 [Tumebacillus algifaecis]|uniref:Putative endonuclease Z1 domain-containing protein n=1 Tax=Tumebacillus algifaecis TaxID=1214604 RepID=A0A223CZB1_9BACL|nr:Z1 domain-containing protein [Tumebacillus algifaecis]ASS74799.1 hypothetical protein CIG75_07285 [Tumebacillus algifaecis]
MKNQFVSRIVKPTHKRTVVVDGNHIFELEEILQEEKVPRSGVNNIVNTAVEIVENLQEPTQKGEKRGLIFGKIQSGKTNMLIGSIAMAADNSYRCFIVLTSDNLWLYDQTLSRLRKSLPGIKITGKEEWDPNSVGTIKKNLATDGVMLFVCTKNGVHLQNLIEVIQQTGAFRHPTIIFDDEADQASLDTNASKEDDEVSRINGRISALRDLFSSRTFVQVTATPQSLFLLGQEKPYRPEFTVLTEPGEAYVGGEDFFSENANCHYLQRVDEQELSSLSGKVSNVNKTIPQGLKLAICQFYVGSTIKILKREGRHFSFLCHVSLKKADHDHIRIIIQKYTEELALQLRSKEDSPKKIRIIKDLKQAYENLKPHVQKVPDFEEIEQKLVLYINNTAIQVINTDGANGQPRYDARYNILIGGTKLGRGVTIERLLVTYYGRQAKKPQMDTVLQHARMYGYRSRDLDVTRIFLPDHLVERFQLIYESETQLRDIIQKHKDDKGFRGIWLDTSIKPTRSNVLDPNELGFFAAGKAYFPHSPEYQGTEIVTNTESIDKLLQSYTETKGYKVSIDIIEQLLKWTKTHKESKGLWSDERIRLAVEHLKNEYTQAYLLVRRGRKLSRPDELRAVYTSADLQAADTDLPTLLMLRQEKTAAWAGNPFWIPVFRFPDGNFALITNLS